MPSFAERALRNSPELPGKITPELAAHLEALADARKWRELKQTLIAVDLEELKRYPRALFLLADAHGRVGFADRAMELAEMAAERFRALGDDRQWLAAHNLQATYA